MDESNDVNKIVPLEKTVPVTFEEHFSTYVIFRNTKVIDGKGDMLVLDLSISA